MLQRAARTIKNVAESAGIVTPSVLDATAAAEQQRHELTAAQAALDAATAALEAAHDAGATDGELLKREAAVTDARVTVERAQRSYRSTERRLQAAADAEQSKGKAAAIRKRDATLTTFKTAAGELDRLAVEMAKHIQTINAQYEALNEGQRDGVISLYTRVSGSTLAEHALKRAVAESAGEWTGDKPTASDLAARVAGAVLA